MSMFIESRRCAGVVILLLICNPFAYYGALAASGDSLTLAEAQRLAIEQSQKLRANQFSHDAAGELTHAAGELPDPVFKLGIENVPVSGQDRYTLGNDSMTMTRVGVMQEFTRGSKRHLLTERATQSVAVADAERSMTLAYLQRDTALAWLTAYYTEQQAQVINEQVGVVQTEVLAIESAYAQGRGNSADVLAAHGMLALTQDQASDVAYRVRAARIALARFIGDAALRPVITRPNIDTLPPHVHQGGQLDAQLRLHPDLQLLERQQQIAETEAKIARAERQANWSVELSYGRRGPLYDDMMSLEVSVPLQINRGNRQNREVASRLALASAAKAQREDMYREHLADVRIMVDEWSSARSRHTRYRETILPLARDRSAATEAAYRGGKAMLEQVIAARRNEIEMAMQAVQLEAEIARLWASVSFLAANETNNSIAGTQP